jgi:uncharacterized protein YtpQ (UPF0354 family)
MTVEKADVIDIVVHNPRSNEVLLVMVEGRDWGRVPGAVAQLHTKFRLYAEYLLSGALARQYPDLERIPVTIRLDHFGPINDAVAEALREWAGKLSGVPAGVCSHRLYSNRVFGLFKRLAARFTNPEHGVVRWLPEPGCAEALLTGSQFTREFADALGMAMPKDQVQVSGELQLKFISPGGTESQANLYNAYLRYSLAPENRSEIIRKYVEGFAETARAQEAPIDPKRILPIVKDRAWLEDLNANSKGQGKTMAVIWEPYNEELVIVYAEDTPRNIRFLTADNLTAVGLGIDDLRPLACDNLRRMLPMPDIKMESGIYRIRAGGDYEASLLVSQDFWELAKLEVAGELVVAVPARDLVLVTGSLDASGLKQIKAVAQNVAAQAPYRLTSSLFVYRQGRFVAYAEKNLA